MSNVSLSTYSNYRIGGAAEVLCRVRDRAGVARAVERAARARLPIFVLGGGTNLLISDEGVRGMVLKPDIQTLTAEGTVVRAGAGVAMEELLAFTIARRFSGLEWAGGLPGTVGGAIRGNAGAFGGEIKDVVQTVRAMPLRPGGMEKERSRRACRFGYRTSVFKERGGEVILETAFVLKRGDPRAIREAIEEKIRYRKERQPLEYPNIGSIFKNVSLSQMNADITRVDAHTIRVCPRLPRATSKGSSRVASKGRHPRISAFTAPVKADPFPVVPTAYLIGEAGLKGVSAGGAMISPKHPNFIVNVLHATARDVKTLIALVKFTIQERFGVVLEEEIIYVGEPISKISSAAI